MKAFLVLILMILVQPVCGCSGYSTLIGSNQGEVLDLKPVMDLESLPHGCSLKVTLADGEKIEGKLVIVDKDTLVVRETVYPDHYQGKFIGDSKSVGNDREIPTNLIDKLEWIEPTNLWAVLVGFGMVVSFGVVFATTLSF